MITRENLTGGMSEVLPAENLPAGVAALIENMSLGKDGIWTAIKQPRLNNFAEIPPLYPYTYQWNPVYMPSDAKAGETSVWVWITVTGNLFLVYMSGENYKLSDCLLSDIDIANLRCGYDSQQFVFVDGRSGRGAQRITIDELGVIHCRRFGTEQPKTFPVIRQIDNDKYNDQKHTGMPVGSILFYCYAIVNEYGERSNPSPVKVCDIAQWLAKGELLVDAYQYTDVNGGSIKSVSVECAIPHPDEAKRIELYRASAEYFESQKPLDPMRLVTSQIIPAGSTTITVTDTQFASAIEVDYENDSAPAGDDIVLDNGTIFIANAVSETAFAYPAEKVWSITLSNKNAINYVNRWFAIDIRDELAGALCGFEGLEDVQNLIDDNRYRFIDSDMITPLSVYLATSGDAFSTLTKLDGDTAQYRALAQIRIPYMQAITDKIIYLVKYQENPTGYPRPINFGTPYNALIDNPVRDGNCIVATGSAESYPAPSPNLSLNKANANLGALLDPDQVGSAYAPTYPLVVIYDEMEGMPLDTDFTHWSSPVPLRYNSPDGMIWGNGGYAYCWQEVNSYRVSDDVISLILAKVTTQLTLLSDPVIEYITLSTQLTCANSNVTLKCLLDTTILVTGTAVTPPGTTKINAFVYIGWEKYRNAALSARIRVKATVILFYSDRSGLTGYNTIIKDTDAYDGVEDEYSGNYTNIEFGSFTSHHYVNINEYISDSNEISALSKFGTHFDLPANVIGWRSEVDTNGFLVNSNVDVSLLNLANDQKPGKIRWSNGGAVPDLYEHNVYEEIKRIMPIRSFQPTDEHNTILIWTDKNVLLMALTGMNKEASTVIPFITGIGLQNRDSIIRVMDGIIWSDETGIYHLNKDGWKPIDGGRVYLADYTVLYNYKNREVLFVKNDGSIRVYSLDGRAWSSRNYGVKPEGFVEFDGVYCLITTQGTYELEPVDDDTTLTPKILTRKIPARNKINRLTLHSSGGTVKAYVYNHRLPSGYSVSPEYTLTGDDPKAIPQLSGDYVQFEIETDSINNFDVEDRNNGN
jgi:hypothetical protein